jgi:hypothetical protein
MSFLTAAAPAVFLPFGELRHPLAGDPAQLAEPPPPAPRQELLKRGARRPAASLPADAPGRHSVGDGPILTLY